MGHGLIRLDGQFDCSLFELGTIRWGFVFAHGRGLTSLADTRLPNCPLQCSHFKRTPSHGPLPSGLAAGLLPSPQKIDISKK
ncbi:hypothetical protein C2W62_33960 [Candidatus Entotheonella serta]|nr:hypothetical protein C2W62_33960 [Candidatus Entotheonella serta]